MNAASSARAAIRRTNIELNRDRRIFSMVQTKAFLGRAFLPSDDRAGATPVVVLSYKVWKERYAGLADVVGRPVRVNGQAGDDCRRHAERLSISGRCGSLDAADSDGGLAKRENRQLRGYAILKPGVTMRQATLNSMALPDGLRASSPPIRIWA